MSKKLNIGLFGFGVVGQGLYDIVKTKHLNIEIVKFAIKDPNKKRSLPAHLFTTDKEELLNNPEINTIVELINDTEAAFEIVSRALKSGKNVVSASKKMIALHLDELIEIQHQYGTSLFLIFDREKKGSRCWCDGRLNGCGHWKIRLRHASNLTTV